jgi:alpha-glucosidase
MDPAHAPLAVDQQLADPASTLNATRQLLALRRKHPALRLGDLEVLVAEGDVLVLRRRYLDAVSDDALLLAFNLGSNSATVPWPLAGGRCGAPLFTHAGAALEGDQLQLPAGAALYLPLV